MDDDLDFGVMVADNIDELENTDSGFGTTHRVNSILVTRGNRCVSDQLFHDESPPTKKKCRRSLPKDMVKQNVPEYFHGKRQGPGELNNLNNIYTTKKYDELSEEQRINFTLWIALCSLKTSPSLLVPGWTGFNILIRRDVVVIQSKITYLDTLDSNTTDMKTSYEVLCRAIEIKDRLNLKCVLGVFDQAFYAKVAEILWKHKDVFKDVVIMLGGFHLLMMFLGVMGTRFGDAGFKDLAIQNEIIAEGSIEKVISGKHYNRAIRAHKIVYEALCRTLYERFMEWMVEENSEVVTRTNELLDEAKKNISTLGIADMKDNKLIRELNKSFHKYRNRIKTDGSPLQKFWFSYLEMSELILNLIYSTRVGDWELYLSCVEQVVPWAFAYDRQKYARYLLPYLNDMRSLSEEKPEVYEALCRGEFSVQMNSSNPFGRNEADKTIENTINRDCKTSGGFTGFSTSFSATQRWVLNLSRRGHYRRMLQEHISATPKEYQHREALPSAVRKDVRLVEKVITSMNDIFTNPWEGDELISISSGLYASPDIVEDLLDARKKGVEKFKQFVTLRCSAEPKKDFFDTLEKSKLKTFSSLKKTVTVKSKDRLIPMKLDKDLFARITLLSQFRKIDLQLVFKYPLGPLPWSISDAFGMPRKTNKATLLHRIEKEGVQPERYTSNGAAVYDGMAVLQKFQPASRSTFGDVAGGLFRQFTSASYDSIHIVFDEYRTISIKNMERQRRGTSNLVGVQYKNILPSFPIKSWTNFMSSSQNKEEMVKFLARQWKSEPFRRQLDGKTLYLTEGTKCWKITEDDSIDVPVLECSHEEADTRMALHAKFVSGPVTIHSDDTDVFIILLGHLNEIGECFMKVGRGTKVRLIDIKSIGDRMSSQDNDIVPALIGLHAFTGCDSISAFAGKGKIKAVKLLEKYPEFIHCFQELGKSWIVTDDLVDQCEKFVCLLYGKMISDVDELRYQIFCAKGGKVDPSALPPCKTTLILHIKRANYQACVWRRAVVANPNLPPPDQHGWIIDANDLTVQWLGSRPAPDEVLELLSCLCKRACKIEECICMQAELKCTELCSNVKCDNMISENSIVDEIDCFDDFDDSDLEDSDEEWD